MSTTQRCEESETLSPASCSLSIVAALSSPEICSSPDLPLSMSGRPARPATPGAAPGFDALRAGSRAFGGAARFGPWRARRSRLAAAAGAAPGSTNCAPASLAASAAATRPQDEEPKPSSHWPSLEAFGRKGKALGGRRQRAQSLKNPPLPRLAPPNRPTYIRPDWRVRARNAPNQRKSGVEQTGIGRARPTASCEGAAECFSGLWPLWGRAVPQRNRGKEYGESNRHRPRHDQLVRRCHGGLDPQGHREFGGRAHDAVDRRVHRRWRASRRPAGQAAGGDQSRAHDLRDQAPDRPVVRRSDVQKGHGPRPLQDRSRSQWRRVGHASTASNIPPRRFRPSSCRR